MKMNLFFVLIILNIGAAGCKKNPVDRLTNPLGEGSVPQSSGIYTIYDDELKTAGGVAFIPSGENQTIDLENQSAPRRNRSQIFYSWNGQPVLSNGTPQQLFAGFQLLVSPNAATLSNTPARNLSGFGYNKLTFYIRGSLSRHTRLRIEGPDDGDGGISAAQTELSTLSSDWTKITLTVPVGDFASIKSFVTFSFQYSQPAFTTAPGEGGVIYLDDIRYEN